MPGVMWFFFIRVTSGSLLIIISIPSGPTATGSGNATRMFFSLPVPSVQHGTDVAEAAGSLVVGLVDRAPGGENGEFHTTFSIRRSRAEDSATNQRQRKTEARTMRLHAVCAAEP